MLPAGKQARKEKFHTGICLHVAWRQFGSIARKERMENVPLFMRLNLKYIPSLNEAKEKKEIFCPVNEKLFNEAKTMNVGERKSLELTFANV